tara:strand:- start:239 stop:487 length:249 start_codon:yes stop_codon:yes gene_type:complete
MVLFSHSSYTANAEQTEKENMIIKKRLWINDAGEVAEGVKDDLPKGWKKGKLLANKGDEITDVQAKAWGLKETKAKKPAENK